MQKLDATFAKNIACDFLEKSRQKSPPPQVFFQYLKHFFKLPNIRWLFVPLALFALSACGDIDVGTNSNKDDSNNEKPSQGADQNISKPQNPDQNIPKPQQKFASIKDFKFLDIADAKKLGIEEKVIKSPMAWSPSGNLIAGIGGGDVATDPLKIAPTTIVSQEKRIYKVDASGNKLFLNYQAANTDTVLNIPYEPTYVKNLGSKWVGLVLEPKKGLGYVQGLQGSKTTFVNKATGSVYLLPTKSYFHLEKSKQGSEASFYDGRYRLDLAPERPTISDYLPQSHRLPDYAQTHYTKNDAVVYHNSNDREPYIKFVKEKKLRKIISDSSSISSKYGCSDRLSSRNLTFTNSIGIAPDGNLLCSRFHYTRLDYWDSDGNYKPKYAHTLSVVKLTLNATASDGIASTSTVIDLNFTQFKPNGYLYFYAEENRFVQLNDMLFYTAYADSNKHLTLLKVYPKGDTTVYEFKDILGDWTKMDPKRWQKDGGSYRLFDDELYLFTKKADNSGYGMWKIDLTNLSAGETEIVVNPKFKTFTSFEKTWFTDDKKFLVEGVDDSGTGFTGRIDLTQTPPTMQKISEFKNEVIRLIKLK